MPTVSSVDPEAQPLLATTTSRTTVRQRKRGRGFLRLVVYCFIGLLALFTVNLIFLPRTSLQHDLRRLHFSRISLADLERTLFQSVDVDSIRKWSEKYTAEPHLAGTNYGLVEWTKNKFEEYGIPSEIVSYDIYMNYPEDHALSLLNPDGSIKFQATLEEDVLEEDPTTGRPDRIPTFHGYSASGNVTGKVIYANYGRKEDYDLLVSKGVDFTDKIVIVRYGHIFRGLKVKFAEDLGAAGVLIYSDPGDDGDITIKNGYKAYPDGPARNPSSVQRGSVQFLSYGPGDPTTPGYPSKGDAERKEPTGHIPKIPSLPISYVDALPILKALNGHGLGPSELGNGWVGGLDDIEYAVGPSKLEVNLYNQQKYVTTPNWNVIGKIEGLLGDEAIVIGNHRDAWIAGGAGDPNSGSAAMIELAKAFGNLLEVGWKPLRTIYLASWDGEEYGLLGSTEWGEDKAKFLDKHVVAYINVDVGASGPNFEVESSPLLNDLIRDVSKRVPAPSTENGTTKGLTVYDEWMAYSNGRIASLGSGSDYTVFQDFLAIPSLSFGFGGGDAVYPYHSNYDSFHWMEKFGDPTWLNHAAAVKLWGLATLSLSEREVLYFTTHDYAALLKKYVKSLGPEIGTFDKHIRKGFEKLEADLDTLLVSTQKFDDYISELQDRYTEDLPWWKFGNKFATLVAIKVANIKLHTFERLFKHDDGLEGRDWFKHIVFAPGRYTGYAGVLLPGITEAIEDNNYDLLLKWLGITRGSVEAAIRLLGE